MSGHNKWSSIKHKKGAADAKRGQIFTKLVRELTISAKTGGGDPEGNPRLRAAIIKARENNMPNDNIDRAIKKGTGELEGVVYEECRYEGYAPGGVAVIVDVVTDNKNRTTPQVRSIFTKCGGSLGETGSVGYLFDRKGVLTLNAGQTNEDELIEMLLDFDVENVETDSDNSITVTCSPNSYNEINDVLRAKNYTFSYNEITMVPKTSVEVDEKKAEQIIRLVEQLEENDDVQNVYTNSDISDEIMEKLSN